MKASELKAGKKVKFGKFEVGYDKRNKLYYAKRHFTSQRFVEVETFAELKEFISANNTRQLKGVADSKKSLSTKKTAPKKKTAKKSLSGTGKNGMSYYYQVNTFLFPTLKSANEKVKTYKVKPKVTKVEIYPNASKPSKRNIQVKGTAGSFTIL